MILILHHFTSTSVARHLCHLSELTPCRCFLFPTVASSDQLKGEILNAKTTNSQSSIENIQQIAEAGSVRVGLKIICGVVLFICLFPQPSG